MATTDCTLAGDLLGCLTASRVCYAILHRADDLAQGAVRSDIDVVVDSDPSAVVARLRPRAAEAGLHLICVWPYDTCALSTFWSTPDASDGVQLDLVCDPDGLGKYGLRSGDVLARRRGEPWPSLDPLDEALYLLRKRQVKGQWQAAEQLRDSVSLASGDPLSRADEVFSRRAAADVRAVLGGAHAPARRAPGARLRGTGRLAGRLARPVGFWVALEAGPGQSALAHILADRFARILAHTRVAGDDQARGWLRDVAPVRYRPGLVISVDGSRRADLTIERIDGPVDQVARRIVMAMEQRVARRGGPLGGGR